MSGCMTIKRVLSASLPNFICTKGKLEHIRAVIMFSSSPWICEKDQTEKMNAQSLEIWLPG